MISRMTVRYRSIAGRVAVVGLPKPDLVTELAAALEAVLDLLVDVDAPYVSADERRVLERAAAALRRAGREAGR
jgi:hypothetical protein